MMIRLPKSFLAVCSVLCTASATLALEAASSSGAPAAPKTETARSGRFLHEVLRTSEVHRETLLRAIRTERNLPNWVRNMVSAPLYVSGASASVMIDDQQMEAFAACRAGECSDSHLRVLFTSTGKFIALRAADKMMGEIVIGSPSPQALAELSKTGL